ncbi:alpha/beta-hydrolase [Coprinellus micaceus]|uniref:Carboxypeptidase n=1 Tax=Coprinellus micaceus TaxID=71717 RepID=A0A4Y7TR28_COPMI|nr:alpha/beta-hydrolase [Coprinellus micaceus]
MVTWKLTLSVLALAILPLVASQAPEGFEFPSSWPQDYAGKPSGDFGPNWQSYFRVTDSLPNVTFPIPRSYAGNLPSGPISLSSDYRASRRQYSWDKVADYFWIDQPVGVGYATSASDGYAPDEDQVGKDFMAFLGNLVKVFPGLASRPLHITGESYAGMYIPYILKAYFQMANPPVKIGNIAIGDGTLTGAVTWGLAPTLSFIETFPQLIGYDPEVYQYFKEQSHLCNYDINLTYPQQGGVMPDLPVVQPRDRDIPFQLTMNTFRQSTLFHTLAKRYDESDVQSLERRDREMGRELWKRDLSDRANGTLDPWYGCFLWDMVMDYALNFTYPFTESEFFSVYNAADLVWPRPVEDASIFLNDPATRKALHAPTSKDWAMQTPWLFGPIWFDPSPVPINFLTELATNATAKDVGVVLFSGNNDFLIPHLGTEIAIQNTTFGGIQGFSKKPSTPWYDDSGNFAGIIHQERGWTYSLFYGAGHMIPAQTPKAAFKFARDFIFGNDPLGSIVNGRVIGGQDPKLSGQNLQAAPDLYLGAGKTESTYIAPAATQAAWSSFIATATATTSQAKTSAKSTSTRRHHRALRTDVPEE